MLLALGLGVLGAMPFVAQGATASVSADPVEPCDVGEVCPSAPETTVTITTTLPTPTSEPEPPETTITKTVTASPSKKNTPAPKPTPTKSTKAPEPVPDTQSEAAPAQPLPTQSVEVPAATPTAPVTQDTGVVMPSVAVSDPATSAPPITEEQASDTEEIPLEVRNAAPEYDQRSVTQQLSIPALILVLLVLFAVLIFEGRLRRMAHAAAVRKAGPMAAHPEAAGYPAGPGYATAAFPAPGYPGGTAYAPIISFVPVQTYPGGEVQYGAVYQDPNAYGRPGHPPEQAPPTAVQEPVVLQPDQFDSFSHQPYAPEPDRSSAPEADQAPEQEAYRSPFEPLIPPEQSPGDIPPGGAKPYEDSPDNPLAPASAAEPGDSEPWQGRLPLPGETQPESLGGGPGDPHQQSSGPAHVSELPPVGDDTVVQPLPPFQDKPKRGFRRRPE